MMYNCVSDTEKIQNRENTKKDEFGESRSHVFQFFLSFPPTKNQAQLFSISRSNKALFNLGDSSPQNIILLWSKTLWSKQLVPPYGNPSNIGSRSVSFAI